MIFALALAIPVARSLSPQGREALLIGLAYTVIYLLTSFASRWSATVAKRFPSPESALNWLLVVGLGLMLSAGLGVLLFPLLRVVPRGEAEHTAG
jgi:membrane protease YdiL (CAAX protease family)